MATVYQNARAFISAAQTAFAANNFAEAKKQARLAQMELAKIPETEKGLDTERRQRSLSELDNIIKSISEAESETNDYNKPCRSTARLI